MERQRENWGSRLGVILAVAGSAVGLGNFLRFPGQAAQYGGGAFIIPYIVAFLLLGLPIAWVEWGLGRYGGNRGFNSSPGVFAAVWRNRAAPFVGVLGPLIPVMIYMYYVFIEAWCLGYAWHFLVGTPALTGPDANAGAFFNGFVGADADGENFQFGHRGVLTFLLICFILNFFLIYRGLNKGIEWFCKYAMPALVVCALIVLIRVLTLGTPDPAYPDQNVINGLGAMWNPTTIRVDAETGERVTIGALESLRNPEVWMAAAGQIFFSLSIGFGIVITYASYLKRDDDVVLSSLTAASGNGFCEVALGGLITIPAAFIFLGPAIIESPPGTFGMGFVSLPSVFAQMPAGNFFGFLFFFLLFLAAITSSLSMLQPAIALLEEGLGIGRRASVALLGFITAVGCGFIVYFSKGFTALDTVDFWVGTFCIYVMATIQVILFAWVLGIDRGMAELDRGSAMHLPWFVRYIIKYVAPVYLLAIFVAWCWSNLPGRIRAMGEDSTVQLSVGLILLVLILFFFLIGAAARRWRRLGMLDEGADPS